MIVLRHISVAFSAAMAAVGTALFIAFGSFYKRRLWSPETEYLMFREEEECSGKQVLVLGLDGAGKSSFLQSLNGTEHRRSCRPTRGFNFIRLQTPACHLDFLEIGGVEDMRMYWADYLKRTHILVYVVDLSDRERLPQAKDELHRLLSADSELPVLVLGNKQDKAEAVSISELQEALSVSSFPNQVNLFLLSAHSESDASGRNAVLQKIKEVLLSLL
ncbi:hypothetical protein DNTS_006508 [Danionella cerebrum]|uniref:ADP-ribosylation factor-like protein 10 n=1 Tax=Danionella cerebrum TaxID=2873325 RepID=A0A553RCF2_9TELE|nr:hypothetical protein DNTS_006508 [Danionella translucida]